MGQSLLNKLIATCSTRTFASSLEKVKQVYSISFSVFFIFGTAANNFPFLLPC